MFGLLKKSAMPTRETALEGRAFAIPTAETHFVNGRPVKGPYPEGLESAGVSMEEIASWIGTYTLGENLPEDAPGRDLVPEDRIDDTLYAAAFTSDFLAEPTIDLESLGVGDYGVHGRFPVVHNFGR